ncbi:MAG TPA: hypothetical protein VGC88_11295 [Terriglobales bacterium]
MLRNAGSRGNCFRRFDLMLMALSVAKAQRVDGKALPLRNRQTCR